MVITNTNIVLYMQSVLQPLGPNDFRDSNSDLHQRIGKPTRFSLIHGLLSWSLCIINSRFSIFIIDYFQPDYMMRSSMQLYFSYIYNINSFNKVISQYTISPFFYLSISVISDFQAVYWSHHCLFSLFQSPITNAFILFFFLSVYSSVMLHISRS